MWLWEHLEKRLGFESVDWVKQSILTDAVGIAQSFEGLNRTNKPGRGGNLISCLSWDFHLPHWGFVLLVLGPWDPEQDPDLHHCPPPCTWSHSRPSGLNWSYTPGFPGSQACGRQCMGLLGLHHRVSQPSTINLFLCIYFLLFLFLWRSLIQLSIQISNSHCQWLGRIFSHLLEDTSGPFKTGFMVEGLQRCF